MMKVQKVNSTMVKALFYDHEYGFLNVQFNNDSRYVYFGVPGQVYNELLGAISLGKFFHKNVRERFDFVRIV